jgi:hypothetical protein
MGFFVFLPEASSICLFGLMNWLAVAMSLLDAFEILKNNVDEHQED